MKTYKHPYIYNIFEKYTNTNKSIKQYATPVKKLKNK